MNIPYVLALLVVTGITLGLAVVVWQRRPAAGAAPFVVLVLAAGSWAIGYAFELGSVNLATRLFWAKFTYVGISGTPLAWAAFALDYAGLGRLLTRRNILLALIEPLVIQLLVITNGSHHLIWSSLRLVRTPTFTTLDYGHGPAFWLHVAFSYTAVIVGTYLIIWSLVRKPPLYRRQAAALLTAAFAPWLGNVLYLVGPNPFPYLDLSPFAFGVSGLVIGLGIFGFRLLDVVPVARSAVIENLKDGVVVLDTYRRVVDLNPTAQRMLGLTVSRAIGQPIEQVWSQWPSIVQRDDEEDRFITDVAVGNGRPRYALEVRRSSLYRDGRLVGYVIILHDVSERKLMEQTLASERSRSATALGRRAAELDVLNTVIATINESLDLPAILQVALTQMVSLFGVSGIECHLLDEDGRLRLAAQKGLELTWAAEDPESPPSPQDSAPNQALSSGRPAYQGVQPVVVRDPHTATPGKSSYQSVLSIPIQGRVHTLGTLTLYSQPPRSFTADEEELLMTIGRQLAVAIERARLFETARHQVKELGVLHAVATAGLEAADENGLLERVVQVIGETLYPDNFGFLLLDEAAGLLRVHSSYKGIDTSQQLTVPLGVGIVGEVVASGRARLIADVAREPGYFAFEPRTRSELCVPLKIGERVMGVINAERFRLNGFSQADERLLTTIASQVAVSLEKLRVEATESRRACELAGLYETSLVITRELEEDKLLQRLYEQVQQLIAPDTFAIFLYDATAAAMRAALVMEEGQPIREVMGAHFSLSGGGLTGWMMQTQQSLLINDLEVDPLAGKARHLTRAARSWLGVPLLIRDQLTGAIVVQSFQPYAFNEDHRRFLQSLAAQVAVALENSRLFEETRRGARRLAILNSLAGDMTGVLEVRELCGRVAERLWSVLGYYNVAVFTTDLSTSQLILQGVAGAYASLVRPGEYRQAVGQGLMGRAAQSGERVLVNDTRQDFDFYQLNGTDILAELVLPLKAGDRVIGILNVDANQLNAFDDSQTALLATVADQLAIAVENVRLFEETRRRAAELAVLVRISSALRAAESVEAMLATLLPEAAAIVGGVMASVYLVENTSHDLVLRGVHPPGLPLPPRHLAGQGITGHVATSGQLHVTQDLLRDPFVYVPPQAAESLSHLHSNISLPLRSQERVIGVLHIGLAEQRSIQAEEVRLVTAIAEMAGTALHRALVMETLEQRVMERTRELAEANEQLQELDRLKSKFVSDVSHELRTPAANLWLYLDLLERGKPEKRGRYLATLRTETERLVTLIEHVLNLSRLDMGKASSSFAAEDLNAITRTAVAAFQVSAEEAGLQLTFAPDMALPLIQAEGNQVSQVVTNLITNAIHYNKAHGAVRLRTFLDSERGMACLEVADSGLGIEPEDRPRLFDRFYRGRRVSQSNIPGTGLGLAIVKEIVNLHGGAIDVQSQPGEGSTFRVWLPLAGQAEGTEGTGGN
ncbi:MAG: GAF domain-containing protein [Chloroflexota bacterium]